MIWIALIVLVALAAGVLGILLEIAFWAVALTVLVVVAGGLLLAKNVGLPNPVTLERYTEGDPLVDGTVDHVGHSVAAAGIPFGVAGLTLPEAGRPVPCALLIAALARLDASFTFLRRSFHADMDGRHATVEVPRILSALATARRRSVVEVDTDHRRLQALVGTETQEEAV